MSKPICSSVVLLVLSVAKVGVSADVSSSEELPTQDERILYYRKVPVNETLPEQGARLYDQVDYRLQLQKLDSQIKLGQAQLEASRERSRIYHKYFGRTPALLLTRQNARLNVLEQELKLKELRNEKLLLIRHRADKVRYRQLILEQGEIELNFDE